MGFRRFFGLGLVAGLACPLISVRWALRRVLATMDVFRVRVGSRNIIERGRYVLAALLAPEIVFVVAGEDFDFAVADFEYARGQLVDEVAVMRHEDHRAGVFS